MKKQVMLLMGAVSLFTYSGNAELLTGTFSNLNFETRVVPAEESGWPAPSLTEGLENSPWIFASEYVINHDVAQVLDVEAPSQYVFDTNFNGSVSLSFVSPFGYDGWGGGGVVYPDAFIRQSGSVPSEAHFIQLSYTGLKPKVFINPDSTNAAQIVMHETSSGILVGDVKAWAGETVDLFIEVTDPTYNWTAEIVTTIDDIGFITSESIFIENASFEDPVIPDGTSSNLIYNPTAAEYPVQSPDGENILRIRRGGWENYDESPVEIPVSHNLISNSFYVLEVDVGTVDELVDDFWVQLWAGTNKLGSASYAWDVTDWVKEPPAGAFMTVRVAAYIPDGHPAVGEPLKIRLLVAPSPNVFDFIAMAHFDNLRLNRYAGGPVASIDAADISSIDLNASDMVTNLVYRVETVDSLISTNQSVVHQQDFYADTVSTNLSVPVVGDQGFITLKPYAPVLPPSIWWYY